MNDLTAAIDKEIARRFPALDQPEVAVELWNHLVDDEPPDGGQLYQVALVQGLGRLYGLHRSCQSPVGVRVENPNVEHFGSVANFLDEWQAAFSNTPASTEEEPRIGALCLFGRVFESGRSAGVMWMSLRPANPHWNIAIEAAGFIRRWRDGIKACYQREEAGE